MAWWVSDAAMMQIEPWPLWMVQSLWICYQLHGNDRLYKGAKDVDKCLTETGERKQSFHTHLDYISTPLKKWENQILKNQKNYGSTTYLIN